MGPTKGISPAISMLAVRVFAGFSQGLALYGLYHWRNQLDPIAFGALSATAWLGPIVFLGAFGVLRRRWLILWTAAAVGIAASLGGYDAFVNAGDPSIWTSPFPTVVTFIAALLYILHHLILPTAGTGRWRTDYQRYFDAAWMDAVRLALSVMFVGLLWALLWLGASLFKLIGLAFLQHLIETDWIGYVATATFFALSIHLTDVRVALVQGARTLLLTLLSWLLLVLTVIAVAFLGALPFTGLKALSAAGSASGTMLAVCAALVVLINATYQEGEQEGYPPTVLKWCSRIAALALVPLVWVAIYGLGLRIHQYGLTPQRINLAACLLVAGCYAAGYAWAALRRGRWMAPLEGANWITAQVAVALLLILFSPLADPMRISVLSQISRLESGTVRPAQFDFMFLRFRAGRWGREALQRLTVLDGSPRAIEIASRAKSFQHLKTPSVDLTPPAAQVPEKVLTHHLQIYPAGVRVPATFLEQAAKSNLGGHSSCFTGGDDELCDAYVLDIYGEGAVAVFLVAPGERTDEEITGEIFRRGTGGQWAKSGELVVTCPPSIKALQKGIFTFAVTRARDLVLAGRQFNILSNPDENCSTGARH